MQPQKPHNCSRKKGGSILGQTSPKAISEVITALSSERTQLAGHLQHIGELATRDSQWAAALTAFSPVLVAVAVLSVGALALWLA